MSETFTAACVQTTSGREVGYNIEAASALVRDARVAGADFILLPETVNLMEPKGRLLREKASAEDEDAALRAFRALAAETGAWLLAGSLVVKWGEDTLANRSFLIDPEGAIQARYDKVHMFDVDLGSGETYKESKIYEAGSKAVTAPLPWGRLGMTVCYDLRFPHLFRTLAQGGAEFISVPSAFTHPTGKAHWHVLLRARAIENGCFIFAPAQCGEHEGGRKTFGHSLIVDPWGKVLADGGEEKGFVTAGIDPARVADARAKLPSLAHDRPFD